MEIRFKHMLRDQVGTYRIVIPFDIHIPDCIDDETFRLAINTNDHPLISLNRLSFVCEEKRPALIDEVTIETKEYIVSMTDCLLYPTYRSYGTYYEFESRNECTIIKNKLEQQT